MSGKKRREIVEEFVNIKNVMTSVLKLGQLRDKTESDDTPRVLMLIVPGNPGVPHFYEDFMQELYSHCEGQVPVWTLGHAGHVQPPHQALTLSDVVSTKDELYGLEAQIQHKVNFIEDHVPSDVSLILIGHSIGCYMILNLLEHISSVRVLHTFMLFPTIERMAVSPNGLKMTPILRHLRWPIVFLSMLLSLIPESVKLRLFSWHYKRADCPSCIFDGLLRTLTPWTANFTTYLAKHEMNKVSALQKDLVVKHCKKLSLYYGATDHWAPVQYYHDLIAEFPYVDAKLCTLNLKHAFVLETREGQDMARLVWEWAQQHHHTVLSKAGQGETWVFDE